MPMTSADQREDNENSTNQLLHNHTQHYHQDQTQERLNEHSALSTSSSSSVSDPCADRRTPSPTASPQSRSPSPFHPPRYPADKGKAQIQEKENAAEREAEAAATVDVLPAEPIVALKRVLRWPQLVALGVGCTIGAGIFVVTGDVANTKTGPALFLSYIVSGLASLCAAFCYAEFAAMAPSAGSAYTYARATMGYTVGWIIGWDLTLEYCVAAGAVAKGWSANFQELLAIAGGTLPLAISTAPVDGNLNPTGGVIDLSAVTITVIITLILIRGIRESALVNTIIVCTKVAVVLFVIVVGAAYINSSNYTPFMPYGFAGISMFGYTVFGQSDVNGNAVGVLAGAGIVFFAYIGFDAVSCQAEECENPQKDLPIGIIGSLLVSTILYVAVSLVLVGMVPYQLIDQNAPFSMAFNSHGLPWAETIVTLGALAGITSVLLVTMMGQPRILMSMARDRLLPPSFFGAVHPIYQTPYLSTALTGTIVCIISGLIPLSILVELVSIGTLLAFTLVCSSVIILRYTKPHLPRPFVCPYSPYIPLCGAVLCFMLMLSLPSSNWLRLLVWLAIGLLIYFLYGRSRQVRNVSLDGKYTLAGIAEEEDETTQQEHDHMDADIGVDESISVPEAEMETEELGNEVTESQNQMIELQSVAADRVQQGQMSSASASSPAPASVSGTEESNSTIEEEKTHLSMSPVIDADNHMVPDKQPALP